MDKKDCKDLMSLVDCTINMMKSNILMYNAWKGEQGDPEHHLKNAIKQCGENIRDLKKLHKSLDREISSNQNTTIWAINHWTYKHPHSNAVLHYSTSWAKVKMVMDKIFKLSLEELQSNNIVDFEVSVDTKYKDKYIIEIKYKTKYSDTWKMDRVWIELISNKLDEFQFELEDYICFI